MSGQRLSSKIPYGYLKGEDGKLVPYEETARVVQMTFQLCAEGNGTGKIARILRERKIHTPSTMKFLRTGKAEALRPRRSLRLERDNDFRHWGPQGVFGAFKR